MMDMNRDWTLIVSDTLPGPKHPVTLLRSEAHSAASPTGGDLKGMKGSLQSAAGQVPASARSEVDGKAFGGGGFQEFVGKGPGLPRSLTALPPPTLQGYSQGREAGPERRSSSPARRVVNSACIYAWSELLFNRPRSIETLA